MKRKPSVGRMATTAKPLCLGTAWHVEFTIIDDTRRSRFRRKCRFSEDGPPRVLKTADADDAASLTPRSDQLPRSLRALALDHLDAEIEKLHKDAALAA